MNKRTLLIIDMQNDYFADGAFPLPHMEEACGQLVPYLKQWRRRGGAVVHVQHVVNRPGVGFFLPGTKGVDIHASLLPMDGETVVIKQYPNAFRETSLEAELSGLGTEELVVAGAMSNNCVEATVRAATDMGYPCITLGDCCAACDLSWNGVDVPAATVHAACMAELAFGYGRVALTGDAF